MKITAIRQQAKRHDRYSFYIDDSYAFSLSETALLESKLASGQELTQQQVEEYKRLSSDDKLYNQVLRYVAMRPRSRWEIASYLERKQAPPPFQETTLNKLSEIGLVDDRKLAHALVGDRRLLRPTSRRKMILELRKKRIADEIAEQAVGQDLDQERTALLAVIEKKRRQAKYQDDDVLMRYLAGQGFSYGDIKEVLQAEN